MAFGLAAALVLAHGTATADPQGEADALFAQGRELLEKGNYAEACNKLQRSEQLSPAVGTLLNLGYCWEQLGRMRSAMESYSEAEILARAANDTKRATFAKERFTNVAPRVMKLVLRVVPPEAPGLEIRRNGVVVPKTDWGQPIAVDPEDFVVTASAPGYVPWKNVVTARGEGTVVTMFVPPLLDPKRAVEGTTGAPVFLTPARFAALALGAVAAAALGAGAATALSAKSRYDDTEHHCDATGCDPTGVDIQRSAVSQGNIATGLFALGFIAAGAGVYLWISGGPKSSPATPQTSSAGSTSNGGLGVRLEARPNGAGVGGHF